MLQAVFAASADRFLREHVFDGLYLDLEYPMREGLGRLGTGRSTVF